MAIDWEEVAQEVAEKAGAGHSTLVFADGTVSVVTGSWEAQKPVLKNFEDASFSVEEAYQELQEALYWAKKHGDI